MSIERGAYFGPEEIEILRGALDRAWTKLSPREQSQITKSELAEHILKLAAGGERDPAELCAYVLQRTRERAVGLDLAS